MNLVRASRWLGLAAVALSAACGSSLTATPDGGTDGDHGNDTGTPDRGTPDSPLFDTGRVDTGHDGHVPSPDAPADGPSPPVDGGLPDVPTPPPDVITIDVVLPDVIVADSPTPKDVTTVCSMPAEFGGGSSSSCMVGTEYSCGLDKYEIQCDCPGSDCTCTKNGKALGVATKYGGCPSCSTTPSFKMIAGECGIPY